jgi:peptidoglycan hydrolase-like protein with peptidoglycan-binding domain
MSDEPTLQKGDSGEWVEHLQELMRTAGFWQDYANGTFDDDLEQAVQASQENLGLEQTGVVDEYTWSALQQRAEPAQQPAPQEQGDQQTDSSGEPAPDGDSASASPGYDQAAWTAFLNENGPRWNGDNTVWGQFRDWFAYVAGQQGLADPAEAFLTYVEGQPEKIAAFAAYGITIAPATDTGNAGDDAGAGAAADPSQAPDVSTFPETRPGDSGEWVAYLDAMLTSNGF